MHSKQRKCLQRCSASFRRQYRLSFLPFRMLCGRHRGFLVMFCFSDVKGNITLCCIAFYRRVSPFPSFPVLAVFSRSRRLFRRAAAFPSAVQNVTAIFLCHGQKARFSRHEKSLFPRSRSRKRRRKKRRQDAKISPCTRV